MKKRVTLYYNKARNVWTHDASGQSFIGWDEDKETLEAHGQSFEKVKAKAQEALAKHFAALPGLADIKPEDVEIVWAQAPARFQPPPVEVKLTNFQADRPALAPDADPAAATAHDPKALKPPERLSVA